MSTKLTFKQHLASLQKLREAVLKTPQRTATYNVRKYCKLFIGEAKETREEVALKPNHKIIVEWLYANINDPTIVSIRFEGVKNVLSEDTFDTFWNSQKLQKWLNRNTVEEQNNNP